MSGVALVGFEPAIAADAEALVAIRIAAVPADVRADADARGLRVRVGALRESASNRF